MESRNLQHRMKAIRARNKREKSRRVSYGELRHLQEYLADRKRLTYRLPNGEWNMPPLTKEETEKIEARIKELRRVLGYE